MTGLPKPALDSSYTFKDVYDFRFSEQGNEELFSVLTIADAEPANNTSNFAIWNGRLSGGALQVQTSRVHILGGYEQLMWDAYGLFPCQSKGVAYYANHDLRIRGVTPSLPEAPGKKVALHLGPVNEAGISLVRVGNDSTTQEINQDVWVYNYKTESTLDYSPNQEAAFLTPTLLKLKRRGESTWRFFRTDTIPQPLPIAYKEILPAKVTDASEPPYYVAIAEDGSIYKVNPKLATKLLYPAADRGPFDMIRWLPGTSSFLVHSPRGWSQADGENLVGEDPALDIKPLNETWMLCRGDSSNSAVVRQFNKPNHLIARLPVAAFDRVRISRSTNQKKVLIAWNMGSNVSMKAFAYIRTEARSEALRTWEFQEVHSAERPYMALFKGLLVFRDSNGIWKVQVGYIPQPGTMQQSGRYKWMSSQPFQLPGLPKSYFFEGYGNTKDVTPAQHLIEYNESTGAITITDYPR
ncbi:hypothetical protein [Hymenobacter sp. YC55]|uniref:hypothetical protein n=1 Tax=Hymenobacter sp. YC55 TaxID=3034019 RepID=UPI0023FA1855|nr:hypothetical protein [Hymenobacter sp. YC55]MDF7815734.1 hypothetical protein [Hymenobacter sp. YC55]